MNGGTMTALQTLNREKMIAERSAMEIKLSIQMQHEKEPHLLILNNARAEIEAITSAYFDLMKFEADRIEQSYGFPGRQWKK